MVAGLPGADRQVMTVADGITSPELCDAYFKCYRNTNFKSNPSFDDDPSIAALEWHTKEFTYETSLSEFCVDDIVTIIDDLIDEKL